MVSTEDGENRHADGRFRKGYTANPGGRPSKRVIRSALQVAIEEVYENVSGVDKPGPALELAVRRVVRMAVLGDDRIALDAIKWIADQLDGKVPQAITTESDSGGLVIRFAEAPARVET